MKEKIFKIGWSKSPALTAIEIETALKAHYGKVLREEFVVEEIPPLTDFCICKKPDIIEPEMRCGNCGRELKPIKPKEEWCSCDVPREVAGKHCGNCHKPIPEKSPLLQSIKYDDDLVGMVEDLWHKQCEIVDHINREK